MPWGLTGTPAGNILHLLGVGPDARAGRRTRLADDALSGNGDPSQNYLNNPEAAIQSVMDVDPRFGIALDTQYDNQQTARAKAAREAATEQTNTVSRYLRGLPEGSDFGAAIDSLTPFFTDSLGMSPENIASFRQAVVANPAVLSGLDDKAFEAMSEDRFTDKVATPGSYVRRGGRTVERVPYGLTVEDTAAGERSRMFNPNTGRYEDMSVTPQNSGYGMPQAAPPVTSGPAPAQAGAPAPANVMSDEEGGAILEMAMGKKMIGQSDARRVRDSMGPGGGAAFNQWLQRNGITVVPDDRAPILSIDPDAAAGAPPAPAGAPSAPMALADGPLGTQQTATSTYVPPKPRPQVRNLTPEEVAAAGYRPGTVAQMDQDGKVTVTQQGPTGSQLTATQRGNINTKLTALDAIEQQLAEVERLIPIVEREGWTGYLQGLVPGGMDEQSNAFDKAVATLTALVRQLTRTPGEGSMSDYESKLAAAIPPSRRDTDAGRDQSIRDLRALVETTRSGYQEMLGAAEPQPQGGQGAMQTGKIIVDGQGNRYRYKGSGPTNDISSYERIQ